MSFWRLFQGIFLGIHQFPCQLHNFYLIYYYVLFSFTRFLFFSFPVQRHFQLGVLFNNETFWSETIAIQQLNSSNESVEDNRKKNIDKCVDLFLWNNQPKCLSFSNSYSTISINILIKNRMLCLTVELKSSNQMNNDIDGSDEDYTLTRSNNFIITIKPRFYIQHWLTDYISVRFKPIIIPLQHVNNTEINNLSIVPVSDKQFSMFCSSLCILPYFIPIDLWIFTLSND